MSVLTMWKASPDLLETKSVILPALALLAERVSSQDKCGALSWPVRSFQHRATRFVFRHFRALCKELLALLRR
jgi:hypothetical protein